MSATPIVDAVAIARVATLAALTALAGSTPVYWQQAGMTAAPFVIAQSQDNGGAAIKWLSLHGWSGLITVRACHTTQVAAEALFASVASGMDVLTATGHFIQAEWERPLVLPPANDGIWQTGGIWRVIID